MHKKGNLYTREKCGVIRLLRYWEIKRQMETRELEALIEERRALTINRSLISLSSSGLTRGSRIRRSSFPWIPGQAGDDRKKGFLDKSGDDRERKRFLPSRRRGSE
jgi:hypothetical protein